MTKRQSNILSVTLVVVAFIALSAFNWFSTVRIVSMSEAELFENLTGTFKILEDFHPSVATCLALFSLTVVWILWTVYLTCCIILAVRWFKERKHEDS